MNTTPQTICGTGNITVAQDPGQPSFLDGNDITGFILHTTNDNTVGTLLGQSTTPTFSFNTATMSYGVIYYISAVVGNNDGNGNVDLNDPCLNIAYGTPVVWNEQPVAVDNVSGAVCEGQAFTLLGSTTTTMTGVNHLDRSEWIFL